MQGLIWAFGLRKIDPTAKLLAIYLGNGVVTARYRNIDVDMAAEFCGVYRSPATILKLAKQLPGVTFAHDKGSRTIRFDMSRAIDGCVEE